MDDDVVPPQRPISPPWHTTFAARGVHPPSFSAFRPHDLRLPANPHGPIVVEHVAWNCDGRRLAAVGVGARVWQPDRGFDVRGSMTYSHESGADPNHVSWNPTHPDLFCTSSKKGRRIVFWDARRDKPTQTMKFDKIRPSATTYTPDGKALAIIAAGAPAKLHIAHSASLPGDPTKAVWECTPPLSAKDHTASSALFNHAGTSLAVLIDKDPKVRFYDYPSLEPRWEKAPLISNSGGVNALALDPYGRYMVTGGADSMINIFGVEDWMRTNTASCEHQITGLSFSHDGEYIAASTLGDYIEIFGTETAEPLHRLKTLGSSPTVSWHPSKHIIAYCGKTSPKEGGPSSFPFVSLFGPGMS